MLAEFSSVVDAVRCAAELQRAMIDREAGMPEDRRTRFRIGINRCPSRPKGAIVASQLLGIRGMSV
jgi:class 3 adenylate cyclase